jgi:predicted transcriptional regulator YheO
VEKMEIISDNEVLNAFNLVIPYLHVFFDDEASIAVSDTEKYLKNVGSAGLSLKTEPNAPVPAGGAAYKAMKEGRTIINAIPKEIYGIAFKSYSVPVKGKSGKVEGCLCIAKSLKNRDNLLELSKELSSALQQISEIVNKFAESLQTVQEMNVDTAKKVDTAIQTVSSTDKIFEFINQVTSQTDLLGINASIEATRAGAEGRGFKVIAQEIRKLSETSRESVNKIYNMLNAINKSVDDICTTTSKSQAITASYTDAFSGIVASVDRLTCSAKNLETMADKV